MSNLEIRQFVGGVVSVHEDLKSFRMEWQNDGRTHGAHLLIENLRLQDRAWLEKGKTVEWTSGHAEIEGLKTYISRSRIITDADKTGIQLKVESPPPAL